mmetsp:Transcript_37839/g.114306  ORF Transcript_37839/g.114306 Transcript_37839/m.114306 type:complete len:235 (-) Transcript_37839:1-705(-)
MPHSSVMIDFSSTACSNASIIFAASTCLSNTCARLASVRSGAFTRRALMLRGLRRMGKITQMQRRPPINNPTTRITKCSSFKPKRSSNSLAACSSAYTYNSGPSTTTTGIGVLTAMGVPSLSTSHKGGFGISTSVSQALPVQTSMRRPAATFPNWSKRRPAVLSSTPPSPPPPVPPASSCVTAPPEPNIPADCPPTAPVSDSREPGVVVVVVDVAAEPAGAAADAVWNISTQRT